MASRRYVGVVIGFVLTSAAIVACSKTSSDAANSGKICTPGNYVFCRCEDRSEGTKLCRDDGATFDDCKCDGTGGPITPVDPGDGGFESGPLMTVDSGPPTGPMIDAKCVGKLGIVAGGGADATPTPADRDTYLAVYTAPGTFTVGKETPPGAGVRGPVTILPVGGSLVATYLARFGYMAWSKMTANAWLPPASLGGGDADFSAPTSMILIAGQLRAFNLGQDLQFHVETYTGTTGWDYPNDPAPLAEAAGDGGAAFTNRSGPATTAVGSSITLAFTYDNGGVARETYSSGTWSSLIAFGASYNSFPSTPAVVALDGTGTSDELMVYGGSDLLMHVATRLASNKTWSSTPILFDTAASSSDVALAPLPGGKAILVYKASTGQGFYSVWSPGTGFAAPSELVKGKNPVIASVPSVTRGQCGSDATIAYAQSDGTVKVLRFISGAMVGPFDVGGIAKATWVGVGEMP